MGEFGGSEVVSSGDTDAFAESLDEITEPLDLPEAAVAPFPPGASIAADSAGPLRIIRLLRDGVPLRLYEAATENESTVWLWERIGQSASLLSREADLLREVECPMFPRVERSVMTEGRAYLATEKNDGEPLSELLARGTLEPIRVASVLAQVAFALSRLHAHGYVHLGLRPGVIVPGRPTKIVDFSDVTRAGERPSRKFYHAGYSPPELLKEEFADPRSDIYAVGALLFHAVGGKPIAETGVEILAWEPETPLPGVPQILNRCLGDKETRYASAEELHRELLRLVKRLTPKLRYAIGAATSIGLEPTRTTNQDAFSYCLGTSSFEEETQVWAMACVADGMGGMEAGDAASTAVVQSFERQAPAAFSAQSLLSPASHVSEVKSWAHQANERVISALEKRKAKGGSTVICACLVGNRLAIAHVGDCRLYLIRGAQAQLLTRDHSLAMALALQGEIRPEEVRKHPDRSRVTRSLGDRRPMPDYLVDTLEQVTGKPTMDLEPGDTLLLCSDGVWEPMSDEELVSCIGSHRSDLHAAAEAIVQTTLARGGGDNATVVLLRLT
jgi:protein phosphatase